MTEILRTATLPMIRDGLVARELDAELAKVYQDCIERPDMKKPRVVTLQIVVKPGEVDHGRLLDASTEFRVSPAKLPPTSINRPMRVMARNRGFGFEADTDSVEPAEGQRRLTGIDDAVDDE